MPRASRIRQNTVDAAQALEEGGVGEEAFAALSNRVNGFNALAIATGSIPNPDALVGMVAVAHATVTPKVTGKFKVNMTIQTTINLNAAAQSVQASIGHSAAAVVDGTTLLPADAGDPIVAVAINGSASVSEELIYGAGLSESRTVSGPFALGVPVTFAALLTQSVAGAFSVNAQAAQISVQEIIA